MMFTRENITLSTILGILGWIAISVVDLKVEQRENERVNNAVNKYLPELIINQQQILSELKKGTP